MFSLPHPPHWKAGIYRGITDEARAWDIDKAGSEVAPDHQPRSGAFTLRLLKHSDRSFAHRLAVRNPLAKGQQGNPTLVPHLRPRLPKSRLPKLALHSRALCRAGPPRSLLSIHSRKCAIQIPQPINLRSRTLLTSPSIMKTEIIFEPPALIRGSGIPDTGTLPTTIPTFTST